MPKQIEFNGTIHEFPDDFTDADIAAALSAEQSPSAPPAGGMLPMAGSLVGSLVGTVGGIPGRIAGAGLGGALGKGAELFFDAKDDTLMDSLRQMGQEGATQAAFEAGGGLIGKALKAGAPRLMQSMLKPSKRLKDEYGMAGSVANVAKDAVQMGIPIGAKAEAKVGRLIKGNSQQVADKLAMQQRAGAAPIQMADVVPELQRTAGKVVYEPLEGGAKAQEVSDIGARLLQQHPNPIALTDAQKMKQAAQRVASEGYRKDAAGQVINTVPLDANMDIARGLRKEIEQRADVAGLNETIQRQMGVQDAVGEALARIGNTQPVGMNALIASGAGGLASGYGTGDAGIGGGTAAAILALTNPYLASRVAIGADRAAPVVGQAPNLIRAALLAALAQAPQDEQ